jgi:hypothetical protein
VLKKFDGSVVETDLTKILLVVWVVQVVSLLVSVQVRLLIESLVTLGIRTSERFFSCMDTKVRLQIEIKAKLLVAYLTLVRLFTSMNKHVSFEFCIVKESFVAKFEGTLKLNYVTCRLLTNLSP